VSQQNWHLSLSLSLSLFILKQFEPEELVDCRQ
jgi:hypothetical protein